MLLNCGICAAANLPVVVVIPRDKCCCKNMFEANELDRSDEFMDGSSVRPDPDDAVVVAALSSLREPSFLPSMPFRDDDATGSAGGLQMYSLFPLLRKCATIPVSLLLDDAFDDTTATASSTIALAAAVATTTESPLLVLIIMGDRKRDD